MKTKYVGLYNVVPLINGKLGMFAIRTWKDPASPESNSGIVLSQLDGAQLSDSTEIHTLATSCQAPCPSAGFAAILEDGTTVFGLAAVGDGSPTIGLGKLSL